MSRMLLNGWWGVGENTVPPFGGFEENQNMEQQSKAFIDIVIKLDIRSVLKQTEIMIIWKKSELHLGEIFIKY